MFSKVILTLFSMNIVLIIVSAGWPLYNVLQLITAMSVLGMPMSAGADLVLKELWCLMNMSTFFKD